MSTVHYTTTEIFEKKIKKLAADHNLELAANEQQILEITGTPTGGTFTLTLNDEETGTIAYNASAADIVTALVALASVTAGDISAIGGSLPGATVTITFKANLGSQDVVVMEIDTSLLTGGSSPSGTVSEEVKGYGDNIIAARRLDEAYNAIESALIPRGLTRVQVSTWARGEEFQLDIATYWYCKDSGWGGKMVDEKDWTTVFDRRKELMDISVIDNDGTLLLDSKSKVALVMDLSAINKNLGITH